MGSAGVVSRSFLNGHALDFGGLTGGSSVATVVCEGGGGG